MTSIALSVDSWREAGALLDHFAYPLRSLCVVPDGMVIVVDSGDPLGPGQMVLRRRDELTVPCWSGPALRGAPPQPVVRNDMAPTGYADLLRMVGTFAIMAGWEALRIVMGSRRMLISYLQDGVPGEEILTPDSVDNRLNDVFWHRAPGSASGPTDSAHLASPALHAVARIDAPAAPYAVWLAALGRHLVQEAGRAVNEPSALLIEELVNQQVLAVYRTAGGTQAAHVVDHKTLLALCMDRPPRRKEKEKEKGIVATLSALGGHLDAVQGQYLSAHQRSGESFVLSYTVHYDGAGETSIHERARESWAPGGQQHHVNLVRTG